FTIISRYIIHLLIKYPNCAIGSTDRADLKGPSENFENYVKGEIGLKWCENFLVMEILVQTGGEMWKFHQKITNQLFTTKNFREIFCKVFEQETKTALNILNDAANKDDTIDLHIYFEYIWKVKTGRRIRKEIKYLDEFAYNIIKERKSKKANDSASSSNVSGCDTTANVEENQIPTFDSIKNFHYAEATLYETLRLYPAVPKNSKSPWCMGRDKKIWGENALQFYPDRFLTSEGVLKPSQFKFPAFHAGPRICLRQQFATVEALTLVTSMLKKYRFELIPGQESPPPYISSITLPMKNPLLVKVYHRDS
ncbi:9010_t:CDS:2, partial [Entrophospora sp. SA101]